ncbi:hypothetical protein HY480_02265 [Candidatus Uhrbacteria bacterium]|nr:hypothetical protein [Candidatus Uhrbacteria bacterium]
MASSKAPTAPQAEALFLTRLTKLDHGVTIQAKVERITRELTSRDDIHRVELLAVSADRTSAFLLVTATRPSVLKRLVGNDLPEIFRSFDDRNERAIARRFDNTFATAARSWGKQDSTAASVPTTA